MALNIITLTLSEPDFVIKTIWLVKIGTDFIGSCKSNYHMITAMMAHPVQKVKKPYKSFT
jgi:hypothetical protein